MGESSGKALIHQPLFLATVSAGYRKACDCLWQAVRTSRGLDVCVKLILSQRSSLFPIAYKKLLSIPVVHYDVLYCNSHTQQ